MIEITRKNIDEDFIEEIYKYIHSKRGEPEEGNLPEVYDILSKMSLPIDAPYFIDYLQGGMMLGGGWIVEEPVYDHPILARTDAYKRCKKLGTPTRVLIKLSKYKMLQPVCIFFKENDKVYAAIPSLEGKIIKQEVMGSLDGNGGEITLEELEELERNLGTEKVFNRVEY